MTDKKGNFMEKLKTLISAIKTTKWKYVIGIALAFSLFYWYEWRPTTIRIRCQKEMRLNVSLLTEINQYYTTLKPLPEEVRKRLSEKYKDRVSGYVWELTTSEYSQLTDDEKKWYEVKPITIKEGMVYKYASDSDYYLCLRRHGLDAKWTYPKYE